MKKIMFNDQFGLTQAVLEGRKTQTRRIVSCKLINEFGLNKFNDKSFEIIQHANYKIGEIVAVAQTYKDAGVPEDFVAEMLEPQAQFTKGWNNKMFVKAWLLPNRIRITDIKVERMQEISNEDCLKEGVIEGKFKGFPNDMFYPYKNCKDTEVSWTAKYAFASLIDKISGKGTWESNPWVFVYEFELVK